MNNEQEDGYDKVMVNVEEDEDILFEIVALCEFVNITQYRFSECVKKKGIFPTLPYKWNEMSGTNILSFPIKD